MDIRRVRRLSLLRVAPARTAKYTECSATFYSFTYVASLSSSLVVGSPNVTVLHRETLLRLPSSELVREGGASVSVLALRGPSERGIGAQCKGCVKALPSHRLYNSLHERTLGWRERSRHLIDDR